MKKRNIPFSPPDMSEEEVAEVTEALRSGWITTGPKTKEFERQIAQYSGTTKAVCLNSATAAMELTLRVLGVGPGDEVIVPAYTYTATASAVVHVGATPVMIDSQKDRVEMDINKVAAAITERTKVIVPVDVFGIPCDYNALLSLVEKKKARFRPSSDLQYTFGRIIIMCDAAHSFGATYHGKPIGCGPDFTTYSFHAVKNFTTAEGGAATWRSREDLDDEAIYKQYQLYSLHGQNKDALAKTKLGAWEYDIIGPWYKCNMTDITAGIGLAQFRRYPAMLAKRRQFIARYNEAFKDLGVTFLTHETEDYQSSGHLYVVRLTDMGETERNIVIEKMAERGIATNVHFKPLPMMTAYRAMGNNIKDFPNAYNLYHNSITLPMYTRLSDEDQEYIIENFIEVVNEVRASMTDK